MARAATLSDEAEEEDEQEQEETAAEKTHEEAVSSVSRHEGEVAVEHEQAGRVVAKPAVVTIERVSVTASGLLVTIETSRAGTVTLTGAGLNRTVERLPAESDDVKVRFSRGAKGRKRHSEDQARSEPAAGYRDGVQLEGDKALSSSRRSRRERGQRETSCARRCCGAARRA